MYISIAISRMIALNIIVDNNNRYGSAASSLLILNICGLILAVLSLVSFPLRSQCRMQAI